jgi:NTP pyrophosphatase (non-canonical NTP hydrolase)
MTLDDYQTAARRTVNAALTPEQMLLDAAAGLAEEAGETLGLVRKHLFQDHPLDPDRVATELGDLLWCIATAATALGVTLDEVAQRNLNKLRRRYPGGFTREASQRRPAGE